MKNNFQWINESRAKIHNVQTFMNGLKSQAFKKHNGDCKVFTKYEILAFQNKSLDKLNTVV